MKKKSITLVAGTEQTRISLHSQLDEYTYGVIDIKSYAIDEGIDNLISDELVILSSGLVMEELSELGLLDKRCDYIVASRTISYDYIDQVVLLPKGTNVLFANDVKETTYDGIEVLRGLGINYLNYYPYYPGINEPNLNCDIAITPGEKDKVPSQIRRIIDIGPRIMDFITITKILSKLNLLDDMVNQYSQKYLQKIINIAKRLANLTNEVSDLNEHLSLIIDGLNDGFLVYDVKGNISVCNENLKKMLKVNYSDTRGKDIKQIIYNKSLLEFLMSKKVNEDRIIDISGVEILVNKFQLPGNDGMVATFKNIQATIMNNEKLRRELVKKGFFAKYTFDDIVGNSNNIKRIKEISRKLAQTELTILIEGESGTGKELFACAIHNVSKRKEGPFLAVNFSALPDELIESELFGYEEGAFTGAKKGGKPGLFEQANGGTIFLDEIGDISLKVQARLLRVLQEKEVMRIGGNEIKPVDVRVIAATNRDLGLLVDNNEFRKDLYYRLKMGYIKIPTLRNRKEDILDLIKYFIKIETREKIEISQEVINTLLKYDWYGNIRELRNVLSYMLAVREENTITQRDIPDKGFFQNQVNSNVYDEENDFYEDELTEEQVFILKSIYKIIRTGKIVGRERLAEETKDTEFNMTKHQMRSRLDKLEDIGLITKSKGKKGTLLTHKGKTLIMGIMGK